MELEVVIGSDAKLIDPGWENADFPEGKTEHGTSVSSFRRTPGVGVCTSVERR